MLYGEEKAKEMAKSLGSSCRISKKEKSRTNKKLRRANRHILKFIKEEDDYYESNLDYDYFDRKRKDRTVGKYRSLDRTIFNHWAIAKTKDIPSGQKQDYIKSLFHVNNYPVNYAVVGLEYYEGFEKDLCRYKWVPHKKRGVPNNIKEKEIKSYLHDIIIDNRAHKILNSFIKESHKYVTWTYKTEVLDCFSNDGFYFETKYEKRCNGPRTIRGLHDIEHFIDDVKRANKAARYINNPGGKYIGVSDYGYRSDKLVENPKYHPEWKRALSIFIVAWLEDKEDYGKLYNLRMPWRHDFSNKYLYGW